MYCDKLHNGKKRGGGDSGAIKERVLKQKVDGEKGVNMRNIIERGRGPKRW